MTNLLLIEILKRVSCRLKAFARGPRPRILLLVDTRDRASDRSARAIARELARDFTFDIRYVCEQPQIDPALYDLIYVFFWGETYHRQFRIEPSKLIKEVSNHPWEDGPVCGHLSPAELSRRDLREVGTVTCASLRLRDLLLNCHPIVFHTPSGYDPLLFRPVRKRTGPLEIGWVGNVKDPVEQFHNILEPACRDRFNLRAETGSIPQKRMNQFYNSVDVFAVTSGHEGEPLTLIEAMAAGCFPVCTDVGIVRELVQSGENGLIVAESSPGAFRDAFEWCESNLELVREAGALNSKLMHRERRWEITATHFRQAFYETLAAARQPRFRNDDVSWDTPLDRFRKFCGIFAKHGLRQLHGVTLRGRTSSTYTFRGTSVQYPGECDLPEMPYARIRSLSADLRFEYRSELVEFLNNSPDQIALHGLYHSDYSVMSGEEQKSDISEGLDLLSKLFPGKLVQYFIAPFNRVNEATYQVCSEFGLHVLADQGVHLEAELQNLRLQSGTWFRYHHHRFYPETTCRRHELSLDRLDAALQRAVAAFALLDQEPVKDVN